MDHTTMRARSRHARHKLRRLAINDSDISIVDEIRKQQILPRPRSLLQRLKLHIYVALFVAIACAVLLGHQLTQHNAEQHSLLQDFLQTYRQHYNYIVHGKLHYCDPALDTQLLFARIRTEQILHQTLALQQLETLLRNGTQYNAIALVGPSGVGKSMFARALEQHFPWRENIHYYAWNTHVSDEAKKFHMLRLFVAHFSDCGRNLLIIDNLSPCDRELVPLLSHLIQTQPDAAKKHVIVLYIFKLNALGDPSMYQQQLKALQTLPDTVTVNFQPLGRQALRDCICREAKLEKLLLHERDLVEILAGIDPYSSGCKNVHAKVLVYGRRDVTQINIQ